MFSDTTENSTTNKWAEEGTDNEINPEVRDW